MRLSVSEAKKLSIELSNDVRFRKIRKAKEGRKHRPCGCPWIEAGKNIKDPITEEHEEISLGYWRYRRAS